MRRGAWERLTGAEEPHYLLHVGGGFEPIGLGFGNQGDGWLPERGARWLPAPESIRRALWAWLGDNAADTLRRANEAMATGRPFETRKRRPRSNPHRSSVRSVKSGLSSYRYEYEGHVYTAREIRAGAWEVARDGIVLFLASGVGPDGWIDPVEQEQTQAIEQDEWIADRLATKVHTDVITRVFHADGPAMKGRFHYIGDCVQLDGDSIGEMRRHAEDVSMQTFARNVVGLREWARGHGYGRGLPLSKDWHVSYRRGRYRGIPAYFLVWSGFECVWTLDGKRNESGGGSRTNPSRSHRARRADQGRARPQ